MDEEKFKQFCDNISEIIDNESYNIDKSYEPFYEAIRLSNEYYTELVSCFGEHKSEESKNELSEISNKLAELSVKYNVVFEINIK